MKEPSAKPSVHADEPAVETAHPSGDKSVIANQHFDVVIVGAGIVGSALASLLATSSSSLNIAILDSAPKPGLPDLSDFDPRVVALSASSQSILETVGAWGKVIATRACAYQAMHVWDAEGTGSIHFEAGDEGRTELGHICENSIVVAALHQFVEAAASISMVFNSTITDVQAGASVTVIELENGERLSCKLVVGADGAHSKLRELADIKTREWDYHHTAIVTTVETSQSHEFCAWQRFCDSGPLAFLPLSRDGLNSHTASIVWSLETALADELMGLGDEAFAERLAAQIEHRLGNIVHVDKRFAIPLRQRFARTYISPGLVLIGDAAHTIHPLAGQGVNLGLYDAKVLAEELARAVRRGVRLNDMSTLRRYERKRQPHNLMTMAGMELFKRGFSSDNLALRVLRNESLNFVDKNPLLKKAFAYVAAGNIADA